MFFVILVNHLEKNGAQILCCYSVNTLSPNKIAFMVFVYFPCYQLQSLFSGLYIWLMFLMLCELSL